MSNQAYNENYGARAGAASMASQEPSQDRMLDQMRDRLASLSDEARSIRAQVPYEFEPDVERIQQQMQRLGERLSDLSRGALVPYNPAQRVSETRAKAIRYVTEEDVRVARVRPNDIIALGGPHGRPAGAESMGAWDDAAASALAELYESGEAYAASAREQTRAASIRPPAQSVPARAAQAVYASSSAVAFSSQEPQRGCTMDTNYLDQRFADIAARIEQSLAQIRPENALASLGRRFDQLETQLNSVLGHVATRADLDELRIAEAQIEEIAGQLAQFRRQLARLDVIDAHLGTLTAQLSDERLTRLFNEGVQVTADVGRLDAIDAQLRMIAVQLSDERLTGLVTRSTSRDYEDLAEAAAQRAAASFADGEYRGRDIGEMRGMLENLINERRNSDENNASMLETMQQAIIRVLDRIDALEMMQSAAVSAPAPAQYIPSHRAAPYMGAPVEPAAPMHVEAPAHSTHAMPASIDDLVPASATVYAEMAQADADHSDFMPIEDAVEANLRAFREAAEADQAPPRVPYTTASFDLDAAFSRSRDAEAESFGEPQPKRSMEVLRHDFIADAHRAKLKAASRPDTAGADSDVRVGQLSAGPRDAAAKPRRRSIFSFRSQRVAMSLLVLLAAIPAAIFFMPRTAPQIDAIPAAATIAPASPSTAPAAPIHDAEPMIHDAAPTMNDAPMMPEVAPPAAAPPPKQTKQVVPPLEKGEYEDVNADGVPVDTASLPDGITMQDNDASGQQLAQASEQQRMAYLSGQLGAAAAKVTPAALMEEHVLKRNGGAAAATATDADFTPANDGSKLPPATVGPFSLRIAAAKGDASAQFEVASRLAEGKGLDQDLKDAAIWYQRAAANGFAMAQFRLGTLYERGLGVKVDAQRAKVWYERAAAQGNVKAMHNLAVLAASADPKGDYEAAARWFQAAADFGLADSQYNLAVLHENGMGVGKDLQQAYKWLLLAAKSGDKDATGRLKALKPKLSQGDAAAAEAQAQEWHPKRMDGLANDARVAGQVWKDTSRRG
jgi:localization factor PodJL